MDGQHTCVSPQLRFITRCRAQLTPHAHRHPPHARFQCRGLRKWCERRCEAVTAVEPPAYPVLSFYCALHSFQRPRQSEDGLVVDPVYEAHLSRRTSFVAPEHSLAAEMAKSPGLVRDRPGAPRSAAGSAVTAWLRERRSQSAERSLETVARMLALEILVPVGGTRPGAFDEKGFYQIRPRLATGAP